MTTPPRTRPLAQRVLPITGQPNEDEVRAARRAAAQHRRRRYPDTSFCGLCGCRWQVGDTHSGKPSAGCFRRRNALELLDVAGLLDEQGNVIASVVHG